MLRLAAALMTVLVSCAQAVTRTWDGGGSNGNWTTSANWDPDGTPGTSDDVSVGSSASVTNGQNAFASLTVQPGATVTLATSALSLIWGRGLTIGGTLDATVTAGTDVLRLNGAIVQLSGSLGAGIDFLDTNGGTINFVDGASFGNPNMDFEHKGSNTFGFKLSARGFKTVTARSLSSGSNGQFAAGWSNVTYNVDISDYDLRGGLRIVLMDFSGTSVAFDGDFRLATVNIIAGSSGLTANLSFDTSTDQLVLTFPYPLTWSGGGDGANWLDRLNWMPTNLPTASDTVLVKSGASVTNGQNTFASLEIQTNATVKLSAATGQNGIGARTLNVAGTLDAHPGQGGVVRLGGTIINLSGHLGVGIGWLDLLNGTMNYSNGSIFDNANMSFEHKGWNTFRYTLSSNGFTTITAGRLWSGNGAAWSNATYNIDVSAYTGFRPAEIVLADYNGHDNIFTNAFNPAVTVTGLDGGKLRFDTSTSKLVLKVSGPKGTLIRVQ